MDEGSSGDLLSTRRIFHLLLDLKLYAATSKTASAKTENTYVDGPFALPWPNRIEGRLRSVFGRLLVLSAPGVLTASSNFHTAQAQYYRSEWMILHERMFSLPTRL